MFSGSFKNTVSVYGHNIRHNITKNYIKIITAVQIKITSQTIKINKEFPIVGSLI